MIARDFSRQPDPLRDPVIDETTVLTLVRRHLETASRVTGIDESGGEARTYIIDGKYIFKTQRPHRVRPSTSLKKEVFHLNVIAKEAPEVSVPRVLGYGREGSIEYTLMTRMPGSAIRNVILQGEARRAVLVELGKTLRRIHSLPLAVFEKSQLFPGDKNITEVQARVEGGLRRGAEAFKDNKDAWQASIPPEALVAKAMELVKNDQRTAVHANPGPEHVFIDPVSLRYQGIIDFGDAYISHPAFDMRRWVSPADRSALMEGYQADGNVGNDFLATWKAVLLSGLMGTIAMWPERRQQALSDLPTLLDEL